MASMNEGIKMQRPDLVTGSKSYSDVTNDICRPLESFPTPTWYKAFAISASVLGCGLTAWGLSIWWGLGLWGIHNTKIGRAHV